jgi:hypothetical protein
MKTRIKPQRHRGTEAHLHVKRHGAQATLFLKYIFKEFLSLPIVCRTTSWPLCLCASVVASHV